MRFMLHIYERRRNGNVHEHLMILAADTEEEAKKESEEIIHSLKVIVLQATVLKATEFERII